MKYEFEGVTSDTLFNSLREYGTVRVYTTKLDNLVVCVFNNGNENVVVTSTTLWQALFQMYQRVKIIDAEYELRGSRKVE